MENNMQTLPSLRCQAHWQNTQSQRHNQILPKSLPALPTPTHGQKDNTAKIKDRITEDKNGQLVTRAKSKRAVSGNLKGIATNKLCNKLTVLCFEMPASS
jgi:hypothetical protein